MSRFIVSLLILARVVVTRAEDQGCTVFVHAGSVEGPDGSKERPFQTLSEAQAHVRNILHDSARNKSATVVCISGGVYRESLVFTPSDSGTEAAPIIYLALPGQNVSISGSVPVNFGPLPPDDPAHNFLPPGVAQDVFVSDLSAAGITNVPELNTWWPRGFSNGGCQKWAPLELIFNGEPQTVARWPNSDETLESGPGWALTAHTDGALTNNSFYAGTFPCESINFSSCPLTSLSSRMVLRCQRVLPGVSRHREHGALRTVVLGVGRLARLPRASATRGCTWASHREWTTCLNELFTVSWGRRGRPAGRGWRSLLCSEQPRCARYPRCLSR